MPLPHRFLRLAVALAFALVPAAARAQQAASPIVQPTLVEPLREVPFAALSSTALGPLGQAALSIRPAEWRHAETANFILHFIHDYVAAPVSTEAEFYYRVVARDLNKDTSRWERKGHIFIFENMADWRQFQTRGGLDPWTGGLHARNELFLVRDPSFRWKNNTLGHEVTHLIVNRFFGDNIPLWLNEGYAEYASLIAHATFYRARGYNSRPRFHFTRAADLFPVKDLTERVTYPTEVAAVETFYTESETLVRFLAGEDKARFIQFFELLGRGSTFETALRTAYGQRFPLGANFEDEFRRYAVSYLVKKD